MTTIIEYATLSSHIYGTASYSKIDTINSTELERKNIKDGWMGITDATKASPASPYFAKLYIKFKNGTATDAVFAIRGTVANKLSNISTDIKSWWHDVIGDAASATIPNCFALIHTYYMQARRYVKKHFPAIRNLAVTGHSLGGALAQLITAKVGMPYPCVTFNAPGVGQMPGVNTNYQGYIHNINSRYGIINKIGPKIGDITYVNVTNNEKEAKEIIEKFNKESYDEGVADLQKGGLLHDAQGEDKIFEAYKESFEKIKNSDAAQHNPTCNAKSLALDPQPWAYYLERNLCTDKVAIDTFADIIQDQHSIENVIAALHGIALTHSTI